MDDKIPAALQQLLRQKLLDGRSNLGHALETVVLLELLRRGAEVGYLRTAAGFEVDFHARFADGRRELRALEQARQEPIGAGAQARVISLEWLLQA